MYIAALHNFILYNFMHLTNVQNILMLHCWTVESLLHFSHLASTKYLFTQYIDLTDSSATLLDNIRNQLLEQKLVKFGVFLDVSCQQHERVLEMSNQDRLYTESYHWLLYDDLSNISSIQKHFEQARLSIDADITYVQPKLESNNLTNQSNFILYDLYNKGSHLGAKLNITIDRDIACSAQKCELAGYLSDLHARSRLQQRKWLKGLTLRFTTALTSRPINSSRAAIMQFMNSMTDIHLDPYSRFGYLIRLLLKDMLDCDLKYIFRDRWTSDDIHGGMIGDLLTGRADLSLAFILSPSRAKHFRAVTRLCSFRAVCMFRNPHRADITATKFLQPFSTTVWLMFLGMLLLAAMLLWFTFHLEQQQAEAKTSLLTSCLLIFGAACVQGSWLMPRSTGGRMAFFALMLTSFLLYNYYTSIVVSSLLGKPMRSHIKTVQQLADSGLDVAIEPTPYIKVYVETSNLTDVRNLYLNKVVHSKHSAAKIWLPAEQGVLLARNRPGYVYIAAAVTAYEFVRKHYLPHEVCELNEILLREESVAYSIVHRNSSYLELFKLSELRIMETGILQKHDRFWVRNKLDCYQSNITVVVGLDYAAPFFIILLAAYVTCLFVLGLEILWHRRQKKRAL